LKAQLNEWFEFAKQDYFALPSGFGLLPSGRPTLKESKRSIDIVQQIVSLLELDFEESYSNYRGK